MPLTRRYTPEWSSGDQGRIGMDFSEIVTPAFAIKPSGKDGGGNPLPRLEIWTNLAQPVQTGGWNSTTQTIMNASDWDMDATWGDAGSGVIVVGRAVYAFVFGGNPGVDYQFRWTVTDSFGNSFQRTGLLLVAPTS